MSKKELTAKIYSKKNPQKAAIIRQAVKRGIKEYAETFRRLANT